MLGKVRRAWHPLWLYLNQPIFDSYAKAVWTPNRFWYFYKIHLLEVCLLKDITSKSHYTQSDQ